MANSNGWGDGASNNNIGWGQGATNNSIYWGYFHALSAAGLTDIVGQTFQPESVAYFTAIEDAGGTLTDNVKAEFDAFVVREKDAGRWDKLKRLYPFLGGKINSAVIDAVTTNAATNNNFVDADADATIGLQSDGSTKTLLDHSGMNSIYSNPFDIQMGAFWKGSPETRDGRYIMGVANSPEWVTVRGKQGSSSRSYCDNITTNDAKSSYPTDNGDFMMIRTSSTEFYMLTDGVQGSVQSSVASHSLSSYAPAMFGTNLAGSVGGQSLINSIGMFYADGFTLSELKLFRTSYKTFINNITAYAASQAYFSAVTASGGTLTDNVQSEFTSFVSREVEAGRWSKIKRLYPFLGGKIASAVIDAVTTNAATNNNFVDGDVDSLIGLQGDASTKYIEVDAGYNTLFSNPYKNQQGHFTLGNFTSVGYRMGVINTPAWFANRGLISGGYRGYHGASSANFVSTIAPTSNYSNILARFSQTSLYLITDGVEGLEYTTSSTFSLPTVTPLIFGVRNNNTPASFTDETFGGVFFAEFDTLQETKDFTTSYKTFITNITA